MLDAVMLHVQVKPRTRHMGCLVRRAAIACPVDSSYWDGVTVFLSHQQVVVIADNDSNLSSRMEGNGFASYLAHFTINAVASNGSTAYNLDTQSLPKVGATVHVDAGIAWRQSLSVSHLVVCLSAVVRQHMLTCDFMWALFYLRNALLPCFSQVSQVLPGAAPATLPGRRVISQCVLV